MANLVKHYKEILLVMFGILTFGILSGCEDSKPSSQTKDSTHKYSPQTKEELQMLVKDKSIHLGSIDTSAITDMSKLFHSSTRQDFGGIESWNVRNVKDMNHMFYAARYFNQPVNAWNVRNVKNMRAMFVMAKSFNQPLNKWNVRKVQNMEIMFWGAESFNQPLDKWDTRNVEDMGGMFGESPLENKPPKWWEDKPEIFEEE